MGIKDGDLKENFQTITNTYYESDPRTPYTANKSRKSKSSYADEYGDEDSEHPNKWPEDTKLDLSTLDKKFDAWYKESESVNKYTDKKAIM